MRYLLVVFLLCQCCRSAEPKPLLVVLEQNPWLMVMGSDSPTFALYEDGTIICLRDKPTQEKPFYSRKIEDPKKKAEVLLSMDLAKMKSLYELSSATDQVSTVIWTPTKTIKIYGSWRQARDMGGDSDPRWKAIVEREKKMWASLPSEIREALARIDLERSASGAPWFPSKIEVMFWPYEYAPDESIVWPKDWPGLNAPDTKKRGNDSFSVFLPSEKHADLLKFLASRKMKGAVLIDGKKMADSFRFPFPGEALWMARNSSIDLESFK